MAYATWTGTGNDSTREFDVPFSYIKKEHINITVNNVAVTAFSWVNDARISFDALSGDTATQKASGAPKSGMPIKIYRLTSLGTPLVDFVDGSTLTAADLDTATLQALYATQEVDDALKSGIYIDPSTGLPTAGSQRVTNVADPTAAQDAATKNYVDTAAQPVDAELTELATMASTTASSLADLTQAEVQILDGATVTTDELNKLDGVTATTAEINYVDGVTSNVQTQLDAKQPLDAELTELATMHTDTAAALADLTQGEVQILDGATVSTAELNFVDGVTSALQTQLDGKQPLDADLTALSSCQSGAATNIALLTSGEIAILDDATVTTAELNTLSGITSSTGELNKLDGVTSTTANLNVVSGMTKATSLTSNSDTELPTSKAVADHVTSVVNALGGFVAINGPTNFPATQPEQGVVVSIKDVGSGFTTSSNEITITNGAGTGKNVRITGFPSEYAAATLVDDTGLQVTSDKNNSTTSGSPLIHRYVYHKQLAKESDVKQLSDDINAFNERYRTATGSNPSSNNHAGDLFFSQDTDKMYVRNAANNAWDEVVSVGEFFINTLSSAGSNSDSPPGGSATFNGTARKFTLSNPPSVAAQLVVSINGVIQKPNAGNAFPSEGFSLNGAVIQLAAAPATDAPFFIITIGSTVNIGTPSAGTVDLAKLSTSNTGSTGQFLKKDGSTEGLAWADVDKITVANEGTDTECFPVFTTAATGDQDPKTNTGLNYNSNTGLFKTPKFQSTSIGGNGFSWLGPGSTASGTYAGYLDGGGILLSANVSGPCSIRFCGNTESDYVGFSSIGSSLPSGTQLIWKLPTADGTNGQALTTNGSAQLSWEKTSSPEVYGFNASSGNLIVTTTNGGADNISASDYAAFEDQFFAATGFSFSINASGNLIATI